MGSEMCIRDSNQRMKTGKFKYEELEQMAQAMGAELVVNFRFPDGTEV